PSSDIRFQQALSTIKSYIKVHHENNFNVVEVEEKYNKYAKYLVDENKDIGGYEEISKKIMPDLSKVTFDTLAYNRHSVRDFGDTNLNEKDILEAIEISTKTPSVCNRQSIKVHYIKEEDLVREAIAIQGGLRGNGENLKNMLL